MLQPVPRLGARRCRATGAVDRYSASAKDYAQWMVQALEHGRLQSIEIRSAGELPVTMIATTQNVVFPDPPTDNLTIQLALPGTCGAVRGDATFGNFALDARPGVAAHGI